MKMLHRIIDESDGVEVHMVKDPIEAGVPEVELKVGKVKSRQDVGEILVRNGFVKWDSCQARYDDDDETLLVKIEIKQEVNTSESNTEFDEANQCKDVPGESSSEPQPTQPADLNQSSVLPSPPTPSETGDEKEETLGRRKRSRLCKKKVKKFRVTPLRGLDSPDKKYPSERREKIKDEHMATRVYSRTQ